MRSRTTTSSLISSSSLAAAPARRIGREVACYSALAIPLLAYLFRDALLHGYVLGQADFLLNLLPWTESKPLGLRVHNPLLGDIPALIYPFLFHARAAVLNGELPLWASGIGAGHPFFASYQTAVLSPFTLLDYLLPFPAALTADVAARLYVGGLGMFLFLRSFPLGMGGALFGGVAFLLNPFSVVWLEHPLSAVAAFLPWLLLTVDRAVGRLTARSAAAVAAVTTLTLLAGHPETAFKVVLLGLVFAVYCAALTGNRRLPRVALVGAAFALGTLIASIQILPFLEYLGESRILSARQGAGTTFNYTEPAAFVTAFVPDFYGTPLRNRYLLRGTNYCEQQVYAGVATLVLAALGLAHRHQRGRAAFFLATAVMAALVMYIRPVAEALITVIPPLKVAVVSRFGLVFVTGLIIAAAIGVDALVGRDASRQPSSSHRLMLAALGAAAAISAVVLAFLVVERGFLVEQRHWAFTLRSVTKGGELLVASVLVVWICSRFRHPATSGLAIGLLALDLLAFGDGFHALLPRDLTFPPVTELSAMQADREIHRVAGWNNALIPNTSLVYGLQDYRSYDGIGVRRYTRLLDTGFFYNGSTHLLVNTATPHLLDLLNIKYILAPQDVVLPADRFQLQSEGKMRVYQNRAVRPRAFLVDSIEIRKGDDALRAIRDGMDLTRTAILEAPLPVDQQPERAAESVGSAHIPHYADHTVVVETDATGRRLLVLTDLYYPGWTATVDGAAAPIHVANAAFRGVSVPAGRHRVEFTYRPRSVRYGGALSLVGLSILLAMVAAPRFSRRGRLPGEAPGRTAG
jgi:hypothetical protein